MSSSGVIFGLSIKQLIYSVSLLFLLLTASTITILTFKSCNKSKKHTNVQNVHVEERIQNTENTENTENQESGKGIDQALSSSNFYIMYDADAKKHMIVVPNEQNIDILFADLEKEKKEALLVKLNDALMGLDDEYKRSLSFAGLDQMVSEVQKGNFISDDTLFRTNNICALEKLGQDIKKSVGTAGSNSGTLIRIIVKQQKIIMQVCTKNNDNDIQIETIRYEFGNNLEVDHVTCLQYLLLLLICEDECNDNKQVITENEIKPIDIQADEKTDINSEDKEKEDEQQYATLEIEEDVNNKEKKLDEISNTNPLQYKDDVEMIFPVIEMILRDGLDKKQMNQKSQTKQEGNNLVQRFRSFNPRWNNSQMSKTSSNLGLQKPLRKSIEGLKKSCGTVQRSLKKNFNETKYKLSNLTKKYMKKFAEESKNVTNVLVRFIKNLITQAFKRKCEQTGKTQKSICDETQYNIAKTVDIKSKTSQEGNSSAKSDGINEGQKVNAEETIIEKSIKQPSITVKNEKENGTKENDTTENDRNKNERNEDAATILQMQSIGDIDSVAQIVPESQECDNTGQDHSKEDECTIMGRKSMISTQGNVTETVGVNGYTESTDIKILTPSKQQDGCKGQTADKSNDQGSNEVTEPKSKIDKKNAHLQRIAKTLAKRYI